MFYGKTCYITLFPTAWKQANVIPILKPGKDPSDRKSYMPISLLNALNIILKRLLLHRLRSHIAEHPIYLNEHFGLREKHSTSHQLLKVTKLIALDWRQNFGMLLFDVEKVFDCVWHDAFSYRNFYVTVAGESSA
jgi:hypothetical protein